MNEKESNVLSVLSLILGIIGLLLSDFSVGIAFCIPALILGIAALVKKQTKGVAVGGIVCSVIGILKIAAVFIIAWVFTGTLGNDGKSTTSAESVSSLIGNWEAQDKSDTYQAGYITADTIEIFWMSDGDASLYWSGSFDDPAELTDGYSWDSVNNKDKTNVALLASGDDTKTFTYSGGKITYEASALGMTQTINLMPSDTDYSVYSIPEAKNNNSKYSPVNVYYAKLANNYSVYNNKRVRTIVPIAEYFNDSTIRVTEGVEYAMYVETDTSVLHDADYAAVVGTVTTSGCYVHLTDCEIEYLWNEVPDEYLEAKAQYEEEQLATVVSNREQFIESAEAVAYDDLRRYPDSYSGKAIKLTLRFNTVDPDGWIFQGDMIATIPGTDNEIGVYDGRSVREPRFMEGDTMTVYATGNGLATIKVKDGTGLFATVIDEYEIPSIKVIYTDMDNLESIPSKDADAKYEKSREAGKQAAEAINEWLE